MQDRHERMHDAFDLGARHGGEEREGKEVASRMLGVGKVARLPAEPAVQGEEVSGRIVHPGADARGLHRRHHVGAFARGETGRGQQDLEHMPIALREVRDRQAEAEGAPGGRVEQFEIGPCELAAFFRELANIRKTIRPTKQAVENEAKSA